ncbi:MAG: autotransporter outer membrane beta-barrel domain-containing protein [Deltaproteobacteria bacterium]|jgi:outer membrane autotransporter protein|nr:autotransporter outer membrane beta-barrel domain-containing protein [Deltaproteobacteria bacterium]
MLSVSGTAQLTENADGTGRSSIVNVGIDGASSPLLEGDQLVLIDAGTLITNEALNTIANGQGMQGVTIKYEFYIAAADNMLTATVRSAEADEQAKALSEGFIGGLSLVNLGADLVAGQGLSNAVNAVQNTAGGAEAGYGSGSGFAGFGALSGGSLRYNSGSHVDMNSVSLMTGLAMGWGGADTTPKSIVSRLTLGAFFEYGNGNYDTHNSFSNSASVDGDGDAWYLGGGVLGRMDFANAGPGRFYTEASARIGKMHNEYGSSDLQFNGVNAEYDSSSLYYGLHLGTGYIWNITEAASLDLYGKYFWTRQEGDSVTLSTGDPVTFKDADSSRLRFGGRFAYAVNEYVSPYIGAAYEHEFDGKARATSNGFALDAPSLRGDTGIGEIGLTFKPSATIPLSFDLGVQGYTGIREGVTGSLQLKFEF